MQMMANLLGVNVTVPLQKEGSALGAAICAGVGAGIFKHMQAGVDQLVTIENEYQPQDRQLYEELYLNWLVDYNKMYGKNTLKE